MNDLNKITELHLDILKEIGNIGAGNGATALSNLLDKKIAMRVPSVKIVPFPELMELVGGADNIVAAVFLRVEGAAPASMFFIIPLQQAEAFIRQLTNNSHFSFSTTCDDEMALSALQELGNILISSYLSALSEFTNLPLHPTVPVLGIDMAGAIISYGLLELSAESDVAVVIDTVLDEDQSVDTSGHFILLPDPDSFEIIFKALGATNNE